LVGKREKEGKNRGALEARYSAFFWEERGGKAAKSRCNCALVQKKKKKGERGVFVVGQSSSNNLDIWREKERREGEKGEGGRQGEVL